MSISPIFILTLLAVVVQSFFNRCNAQAVQHGDYDVQYLTPPKVKTSIPVTILETTTSSAPVATTQISTVSSTLTTLSQVAPTTASVTNISTEPASSVYSSESIVGPCTGSNCVEPPSVPTVTLTPCSYNGSFDNPIWDRICNVDFPAAHNIYPFLMTGSYDECLGACNEYHIQNSTVQCQGFVFAPDREEDQNDCYLKSSVDQPFAASLLLLGATLIASETAIPTSATQDAHQYTPSRSPTSAMPTTSTSVSMLIPTVSTAQLLGASTNNPTKQYVSHKMALPVKLPTNLLKSGAAGINLELTTNYQLASDTGTWTSLTAGSNPDLANMIWTPHLSRDGGKGGIINGSRIFIFCDTGSYNVSSGALLDLKSASAAVDQTMNGLSGKPLVLVDGLGGWQDNISRMRGFGQLTTGEEAFNVVMAGDGYRYAVWPESSLIPLNSTHSILYASLVYDQVNMQSQAANFTTLGNTLLVVSIDPVYGPSSQRISQLLFQQPEVPWGTLGGIRSWGSSGPGSNDGSIYVFGQVAEGVLLARTTPDGVANRSAYTYWDGSEWSSGMLPPDDTSYVFNMSVMDLDVIYSPYHKTFIAVYLTSDADNTFYFRYLKSSSGIVPSYEGGRGDLVENIVKYDWSEQKILYKAATPAMSYIYSGAVHASYFGSDDITDRGKKMLISWTEHTGQDPTSSATGYAHMTVVVSFE